jgi:DNA (cytosine-5)-methyltransferase 1
VKKLRVLDLFSGIGGFSLGLERTGGFETVAFCEIEEFPRRVLAKHWPEVPCYHDVRELTAKRLSADGIAVDVITGGFPCQDISSAGKQVGINSETRSGLWSEIIRLACELRPQFIIVENVANLLAGPSNKPGGWFGRVLGDLAECGYDAEWENIPAAALGLPHLRERVWILAHPNSIRLEGLRYFDSIHKTSSPRFLEERIQVNKTHYYGLLRGVWDANAYRVCRDSHGVSGRLDRLYGCGNSVVPQIPEQIGHAILESLKHQEAA